MADNPVRTTTGLNRRYFGVSGWDVLERDGWECRVRDCCGPSRVIGREAPWGSPWSASVDHVVPRSRGGDNSPGNRRAAHLLCNKRKGHLLDEELG